MFEEVMKILSLGEYISLLIACLFWGLHLIALRSSSWLYDQGLLFAEFRKLYMLSGIESGSATYKINTLLAVVSLHKNTFHFSIAKMNYNKRKTYT